MGAIIAFLPSILKSLPLILQFLPLVVSLVKQVEELFGAGHGGSKKEAVVKLIRIAIDVAEEATHEDLVKDEEKFAEAVGTVVDLVVSALNQSGQLKKG